MNFYVNHCSAGIQTEIYVDHIPPHSQAHPHDWGKKFRWRPFLLKNIKWWFNSDGRSIELVINNCKVAKLCLTPDLVYALRKIKNFWWFQFFLIRCGCREIWKNVQNKNSRCCSVGNMKINILALTAVSKSNGKPIASVEILVEFRCAKIIG